MKNPRSLTIAAVAILGITACGKSPSGPAEAPPEKTGPVVAVVGDTSITLGDLDKKLEPQPITRTRLTSLERKKEFLDNVIRFELLAQEASRMGLEKDPDVQEAMKRMMVQKLSQVQFENKEDEPVSEEEARAFYQENVHDYVKEERVRVAHVFFAAPKDDPTRPRIRGEAGKALAEVRQKEGAKDRLAFSQLAKTRSDDEGSKRAGGDLSFRTRKELEEAWGPQVANAVFSLKSAGDFAPLVESEKGFHILKMTGHQPPLERTFESVRAQIENRLTREKKTKAFEAFVEDLKGKTKIRVDEEALDKLEGGGAMGNPLMGNPLQMGGAGPGPGGSIAPVRPAPNPLPVKAQGD